MVRVMRVIQEYESHEGHLALPPGQRISSCIKIKINLNFFFSSGIGTRRVKTKSDINNDSLRPTKKVQQRDFSEELSFTFCFFLLFPHLCNFLVQTCRVIVSGLHSHSKFINKMYDVSIWLTNNYNTHIVQYLTNKNKQTMKFGQLIDYNKKNIFLQKHLFLFFKKLYMK